MFKFDSNAETLIRNWPVVISVPQDGGSVQQQEVTADFLMLPQSDLDEQLEASRDSNGNADADILRRVVKGLKGVADNNGATLDFSANLLDSLINVPYVRSALIGTYFEATSGKKARRKN